MVEFTFVTEQRTQIVEMVKSGESLQGRQLPGINLRGADLRGADLRDVNLSGANLFGADLGGADLRGANCVRTDFQYADLREANLEGADLRKAKLQSAQLRGADLTRTDLAEADLSRANLTHSTLTRSKLQQARLRKALLDDATAHDADLSFADLREASLRRTKLVAARLKHARLEDALLQEADLTEAMLENADLTGAITDNVKLGDTTFAGCRLQGCDFAGVPLAEIESCDWEGAVGRGDPAPSVAGPATEQVPAAKAAAPPGNEAAAGDEAGAGEQPEESPADRAIDEAEIPEAIALPGLTIEMDADRITTEQMIRCLLFLEAVIKESGRVLRIVKPNHPGIADIEIQVIGSGSEPARIVVSSTPRNQALLYALVLYKKSQIDARKVTRVRIGEGFGLEEGEQEDVRRDRAMDEARDVLVEHFEDKVVAEILSFVSEQLDAKYGGPLIPLLRQITLAPDGCAPRVYRFRKDMQISGVFTPR